MKKHMVIASEKGDGCTFEWDAESVEAQQAIEKIKVLRQFPSYPIEHFTFKALPENEKTGESHRAKP